MHGKRAIIPILLIFGLLASLYGLLTPLWEAPDEPAHYLYVKHVTQHWRPPHTPIKQTGRFFQNGYITSLYEWHHPALYYTLNGIVLTAGQAVAPGIVSEEFPPVNPLLPNAPSPHLFLPDSLNPLARPRHHWGPLLLRLFSVGLASATVWTAFRLSRLVVPGRPAFAVTVAGLVAFVPQFTFLSATINNDNLANLLSSLTVLLALRIVITPAHQPLERSMSGLGGLLALGLLTKLTLAFLLPLAAGVWLVASVRCRCWSLALRLAVRILLPIVLLVGVYYLVFPEAQAAWVDNARTLRVRPEFISWDYIERIFDLLPSTFWGRFGWASLPIPLKLVDVLGKLVIAGLLFTSGVTLVKMGKHRLPAQEWQAVLLLLAAVALNFAGFIRFNLTIYQPQGRFLFPTLAPLFVLMLMGAWRFVPHRWQYHAAGLIVGAMLLVNLYALTQVLVPGYYHRPLPGAFQNISSEPVGEIRQENSYGQSFVSQYNHLGRIDVMLATFARENHYPVVFHLRRAPGDPDDLVSLEFDASTVADNAFYTFSFDPMPDSAGQAFYFFLDSPQSVPGDAITIWATTEDAYPSGTRHNNHQPVAGDLRFIAYSTP